MIPDDPYVCPVVSGSRIVTMAFMNRSRDLKKPRCNPIMEGLKKTQGRNWFFWVWSKIPGLILEPCMETQSSSGNITKHTNPITFKVHCGLRYIGWFYPPRAARQLCVKIAALDTADPDSRHVWSCLLVIIAGCVFDLCWNLRFKTDKLQLLCCTQ